MKRGVLYLHLLFMFSSLSLNAKDGELFQAHSFFEAGNFNEAKKEYQIKLDESREPWEKEILRYNIATAYLAEGNIEEAIILFKQLSEQHPIHPLIDKNLHSNLALASLIDLSSKKDILNQLQKRTKEEWRRNGIEFKSVFSNIQRAEKANCRLHSFEGSAQCTPSEELRLMRSEANRLLANFFDDEYSYLLSSSSIQEGILFLLLGIEGLQTKLHYLFDDEDLNPFKQEYLEVYLQEANSWIPLWKSMQTLLLPSETKLEIKDPSLFTNSYALFNKSIQTATKGMFKKSLNLLEDSQNTLKSLLDIILETSNIKDILQQLINMYDVVLMREPLTLPAITQLKEWQSRLGPKFKSSIPSKNLNDYKKAEHFLEMGHDSLSNEESTARIYAEIARFYIQNMSEKMSDALQFEPSYALKKIIEKEEFITLLTQFQSDNRQNKQELKNELSFIEKDILIEASLFPSIVITKQQTLFQPQTSSMLKCQCHPWDEVIPLFNKGYETAKEASNTLEEAKKEQLQKKSIQFWKEALFKINSFNPSKNESKEEKNDQKLPSQSDLSENPQFSDILQFVQEMEYEDRSKPQIKESDNSEGDRRPW